MAPLLLALAAACGLASTVHYRGLSAESRRLESLLVETGLAHRSPAVARSVRREPDPGWGAVLLARALLAEELDRSWIAELAQPEREAELERSPARVATAYREAARVLVERPANWQAAMTTGGAAYLSERRGIGGDGSRPWEPALALAHRLGPQRLEPARMFAAALIGHWSSLGETQRAEALPILAAALRDEVSLELLLGPWLRVAPGLEAAFAVLPDVPNSWHRLQRHFERLQDWERYAAARRRWYPAQHRELERRVADGERRLRTGDSAGGRNALLRAAAAAPVETGFAELFSRAVRLAPPDWRGRRDLHHFHEWLGWSLALDSWGHCPLPGDVLARLVRELQPRPDTAALAELAAGNLGAARALARRAGGDPAEPAWAAFRIREALVLHERGQAEEARAVLLGLPPSARDQLAFRWAVSRVAATAAMDLRSALARAAWSEAEWERSERRAALRLLPERSAPGLELWLAAVAPEGSVIEIFWAGRRLAIRPVAPQGVLRLAVEVEAAVPQRLEVRTVAGRPVAPGGVSLLE